jgi:hypothetical protein
MIPRTDATGRPVTRTPQTIAAYRKRYLSLCRLAGRHPKDLAAVVGWFGGEHERWVPSTVKQYRAALIQAIEDAAPAGAEELLAGLKPGPLPRKSGAPKTSARKRKSIPEAEFTLLINALRAGNHPDDRLAARLINHNVRLFLRPSEWRTASH